MLAIARVNPQDMVLFDGPDSDLDGDILNSDPKTRFDRCVPIGPPR
jgi:hypothetical protein